MNPLYNMTPLYNMNPLYNKWENDIDHVQFSVSFTIIISGLKVSFLKYGLSGESEHLI